MRQFRARLLIPFAVTALSLVACSSQPTSTTRAEMEAQASAAFNRMRADVPLVTDRPTIDFVACVSQAVVDVLEPPYNDIDWELAIFEADSVNAFAMPGGKIGVFSGILKVTENEHQLAAVIGHEIAHVTLNHAGERASRAGGFANFGINALAIILGGGYTGATYTAQQALYAGATVGITLPYSRGRETEADTVGLDYMARAGFDPRESVPLWQRMAEGAGNAPAEFMSTHPAPDTRIENLIGLWQETLPLYNEAVAEGRNPDCGGQSPRYVKDLKPEKKAN
ncbi:MAG: M48 family metallopeptidase [Gammaproteobacteria bacterium]|nr:M48 family metallopeptidase [Gammaproteobacteria bacterium]NNF49547.1 M48 family metallopeptidase [Woeseiaceae bacterium]MBT8093841.1 M48 family metallopeptidase [Gammaproteobacteria bacterium]MBT8105816.1 M48 family metallopeptidase [Gammaproteobacteria bacterium]NNK25830.1 M48 family metallopeptidase [Woeseiaceae bacterium]